MANPLAKQANTERPKAAAKNDFIYWLVGDESFFGFVSEPLIILTPASHGNAAHPSDPERRVILSPLASGSTTFYVSTSGNNNNGGTNPSNAFADIQAFSPTIAQPPIKQNFSLCHPDWCEQICTRRYNNGSTRHIHDNERYHHFQSLGQLHHLVDRGTISPADGGGNGVSINKGSHHITIQNLDIHDFGGGGIGTISANYVTVEGNLIHNTTYNSIYGNSAISLFESIAVDNQAGYHFVVRNNVAWDNFNILPLAVVNQDITDGNCIMMDTQPNFRYAYVL